MPRNKQREYCRFLAVSEWQLKVSYSSSGGHNRSMEATYNLQRLPDLYAPGGIARWAAQTGSGKAKHSYKNRAHEESASGTKIISLESGNAAELEIYQDRYSLRWSAIEVKGKIRERDAYDRWQTLPWPYEAVFGDVPWGSEEHALPKQGMEIKGLSTWHESIRLQWSLVPIKEITFADYEIKLRLFIPAPIANVETERGATEVHVGDDREFSYDGGTHRAMQKVTVSLDPRLDSPKISGPDYEFGESITYQHAPIRKVPGKPWWWYDVNRSWVEDHNPGIKKTLKRTNENSLVTVEETPLLCSVLSILFQGAAANPAARYPIVPDIDWGIRVMLEFDYAKEQAYYQVLALHDGFPAYELYLNKKRIYEYDPEQAGNSPLTLIPIFPPIHKETGKLPIP